MPIIGAGGIAARRNRQAQGRARSPSPTKRRSGRDSDEQPIHHPDNNDNDNNNNNHLNLRAQHPHPRLLQEEQPNNQAIRFGFSPLDDVIEVEHDADDDFYDADDGTAELEQALGHESAKKRPIPWYKRHWFPKRLRKVAGAIVENEPFQIGIVALIAINALMLGIGTFDFVEDNPFVAKVFNTCDLVFLIIFTIELVLQVIYRDWRIFLDGWLTFDFIIILFSWIFSDLQVIRAFRIFRALRLISRVQTLRSLVEALCSVVPKMVCIGGLLGLVFYIFAVMFTDLFRFSYVDGFTSYDYFSTLDATLFTLFQIMTMDNWAEICRECMQQYTWAWIPFTVFVVASGFVVVNLIIAVICESISSLNEIADGQAESEANESNSNDSHQPSPKQLRQEIDDLTILLAQMQASQFQGRSALERLTVQLRDAGAV
jgi:hypothetical protein